MSLKKILAVPIFFGFLTQGTILYAAEASFYSLNERWEKEAMSGKTKRQALDEGFGSALSGQSSLATQPFLLPTTPAIKKTLSECVIAPGGVEIQLNQSLFVNSNSQIVKFVTTDEGIVSLENQGTDTVHVQGTQVGSTFVHIWDESGRKTFAVRVIQPKYTPSRYMLEQTEEIEKNRSFKFGYDNSRSAYYTGPKFRLKDRSSLDFNQNFSVNGDTPYGELDGHAQTQKSISKTLVTDIQLALKDGKVGKFDNFNAAIGDSSVRPNLMVFPTGRIRGGELEHWTDDQKVKWMGFYGREQNSIIGTLTPGVVDKRTFNSYLSGGVLDYQVNDAASVKAGAFTGSGTFRDDDLNRKGAGVQSTIDIGKHLRLDTETDFDNEHFAHRHALLATFEKLQVKNEFRDISKKFFTMLGAPSRQGEIGNLTEFGFTPTDYLAITGDLDIFRDRLIFNPEFPNRANIHRDLAISLTPSDTSSITLNYQDLDDTGRIGPTRQRTLGGQYNQRFTLLTHPANFFMRYQNRTSNTLTNSLNNYVRDQVITGFYLPIIWDINLSVEKEWSMLRETTITRTSYPEAMVYLLDYSKQLPNSPFYLDLHLRLRDEEETESSNSFMSGEDSVEVSGGLAYREYEDLELFINGSFTQYNPESLDVADHRMEAQFLTGMRYVFDTKVRWSISGSFEGYVFKDLNGNGSKDPGEPGLKGMVITSGEGKEFITDENGYFRTGPISGKVAAFSLDSAKIPYGFAPTNSVQQRLEIQEDKTQTISFGLTPRSELTGIIYNDLNGDGKYQTDEPGISKVKVSLEDGTTVRTNGKGVYSFPSIVAGDHTVSLVLTTLADGYLPAEAPRKKITIHEGIRFEQHFPVQATRAVTGRVFYDDNRNGRLDQGESPAPGVTVLLAGQSVVSDNEGYYLFDRLSPGSYALQVDPRSLPAGYIQQNKDQIVISQAPITESDRHIGIVSAGGSSAPAPVAAPSGDRPSDTVSGQ